MSDRSLTEEEWVAHCNGLVDRIEQLEAALRGFCHVVEHRRKYTPDDDIGHDLDFAYDQARRALENKHD